MKKTVRTYTKRTLAVFMAALMLLTAWVFVAPEKADAATAGNTRTLSITYNWSTPSNFDGASGLSATVTYNKSTIGGTGTGTASATLSKTSFSSGEHSGTFTLTATVAGTPTSIAWSATLEKNGSLIGSKTLSVSWSSGSLGGYSVSGGGWSMKSDTSWNGSGSSGKSATSTVSCSTPTVTSVSASLSSNSLTIPKTSTDSVTTTVTSYALDQYGFRLATSKAGTPTVSVSYTNGTTVGSPNTSGATDSTVITVKRGARMAGNTNTKTVTVTVTYGSKSNTATYTLTDPTYTYTYNANGGSSLNATISSFSAYYGQSASNAGKSFPTGGNYVGYEYIGMYDTQKSANYGTTKPTTSSSGYTGNITASTALQYDADQTFYAAWWAKNVNVTYLNNDGSVLKTSNVGKYDQKANYTTAMSAPANPTYVRAPGVEGTFDYVFDHWEVASAKKYTTANSNTQADYSDLVGTPYSTAVLKGDTVFVAVYRINSMNTYTINYKNGTQSGTVSTYHYKDEGKTGSYATATYPASDAESKTWTYQFLGWAEQVNATDTVYYQDWDADLGAYVGNPAQTPLTDTKVYHNATWVAVYGRKYIDYKVTFNFVGVTTDETGATTYNAGNQEVITKHYDETIQIPEALSYTGGKLSGTAPAGVSYSNSTGYTYNFSAWNPALSGTEVAVADLSANGWTASNANLKTRTFTATYSSVAAVYTIKFVGPDTVAGADGKQYAQYDAETGELLTQVLNPTTSFSHGSSVSSAKNAAEAAVVRTYRDDDNEYTFTGWAPTYASTATDNVTYNAQYNVSPLYTVTYEDETGVLGTWKGTTSEYIPLTVDGVDTPTKEDDLYATDYTFSGWATTEYDAKNPVNPAINLDGTRKMLVPENGTTVYAQFGREPIVYTINFIYGDPVDGVMPDHKQELEYEQDVTIPSGDTLNRSDDETYHYTFANWDTIPSATVTGDATYTANYRKSYVYYDVIWLYQNGEKEDGKDFRVEKYIYGERIRAPFSTPPIRITDPAQDPLLPELEENHEYAFDQWVLAKKVGDNWVVQRDAENNPIPFSNNTYIEAGVEYAYLPTYKSVAALRTLTILDEDGTTVLGTMPIGFGDKILDHVDDPEAKSPNADYHYAFEKWVYVEDDSNTYAENATVTAADTMEGNISIKAVYVQKAHSYRFFDTKTVPNFDEAGIATLVCEADGCGHTADVGLPALSDSELPTVRLYVKNTYWDSTVPPALTVLDDTVIPIAPNSLLIANSTDGAEVSAYYINKVTKDVKTALATGDDANDYIAVEYSQAGGSGVTEIWAYYSTVDAAYTLEDLAGIPNSTESNPDGWHLLYDKAVTPGEANHSDVFASFEPAIVDGEQYIVYLKAIDAKGNENYISSVKLGYDTTAPSVDLTTVGGGNEAGTKFCLDATIVLNEADPTVLLDGEPITMTAVTNDEDDTVTYEYEVTAVGKHTVRVTDPAGNVTLKAFQIIGEHKTTQSYKAATCTEPGWQKTVCTLCSNEIGEVTNYPATGHDYQTKTKRATCTEAGYTQEICSKCHDEKDPEPIAALGHNWNDGTITKQPNCTENGRIVYRCTRCGINDIVEGDALDTEAASYDAEAAAAIVDAHPDLEDAASILHDGESHSFKADRQTTNPTCTEQGEITHECRYCHEVFHVADVNALGHDWTADENNAAAWTVGKAPTCDEAGYKYPTLCARCSASNTEKEGQIAIPAIGHLYEEDTEKSKAPDKDENDQWITYNVFIGEYYIDDEGNMIDDANKVGEMKTVYGYAYYVCGNDEHHIKVTEIIPEVEYTYTFKVDGVVKATVTKNPGEQITEDDVPEATKAASNTTRYIFDMWVYEGTTDEAVFPMIISQDTGDKTFVAKFREETIYYTISFYEDNGTTKINDAGFKTYGQEFVQPGPEKAADANNVYTFVGWVPLDWTGPDDPDAVSPVTTIKVLGNASYKAYYEATARTYTVVWEVDGKIVKSKADIPAGSTLGQGDLAYPADPSKDYDDFYHYTFTGWSPAAGSTVAGDTRIVAQFQKTAHVCTATTAPADCTHPARTINACACGYRYETTSGKALGHDYSIEVSRVNPTADADGYKVMKCSRCGDQTTVPLSRIYLKVTVKDQNGNKVSGVKVDVYDGNTFINSGTTGSDGVATILVPEAKTYRIVIEGREGTVTVDENGRVTNSSIPTVERSNGGGNTSHGCDCTCHKSGFWPMIFRFFHKIIKLITGEFRCCPDANY